MDEKDIKKKIDEVEKKLMMEINCSNYDYYDRLLDILRKLWDHLYFKVNQEKNYLLK